MLFRSCFAQVASAMEVFGHSHCGACGSDNVTPQVREVDGNMYYELKCNNCHAALSFGQKRSGGQLFPRRKDKANNWLDKGGWVKWSPKTNDEPF